LIAGAVIDSYVKNARCCVHLAIDSKLGLNIPYIQAVFDYMFNYLNCNVVIGMVDADNNAALRLDKHFGFSEQTRIPGGSGDCDLVVLVMSRDQCRWLPKREEQKCI
jgi:hypothetical protein